MWSKEGVGSGKEIDREREGKSNERQRVWSKEGLGRGKEIYREREGKSNERQRVWSNSKAPLREGDRQREGKINERQRVWSKEGMGRGKGIDRAMRGKGCGVRKAWEAGRR